MSNFSFSFYLNAYSDNNPSNAPSMNNFKWIRNINSLPVNNPTSVAFQLAPGEARTLFSGMRTLSQDNTTQYSIALKPFTSNTYVLSAVAGTLPNFRTPRVVGSDATTQVNVTTNGPVATFTSVSPTFASFAGQVPGMISPVVITAVNSGTVGNSVVLTGDGSSTISALISTWNTSNPSNTIALTTGNGAQIPNSTGVAASYTGTISGTATPVTITANSVGIGGNSVLLVGDGTSDIAALIAAWNTANPSNMITLSSGDGTQVPSAGTFAHYTGVPTGTTSSVTITANVAGTNGNSVLLVGDGTSDIDTLIANWNINNSSNTVSLTSGSGTQVPSALAVITLGSGTNPATAALSGGVASNTIALSGGSAPTAFNLISGGVQVGDYVRIGNDLNSSLNVFSQNNWGEFQIIALTATSFSINNGIAVTEGPITLGSDFANQISIYSALSVQIGDTLEITGGFSPVTQGSYSITDVAANFLEFYSTNVLPQESNILTEAIAIYSLAKKFIYLEADQECAITINGLAAGSIKPFIIGTSTCPGVFVRTDTIFSIALVNSSLTTANLFLATVE